MARPHRMKEMGEQVQDLEQHILTKLAKHKGSQKKAAEELGISEATLYQWLKANGYTRSVRYIKEPQAC